MAYLTDARGQMLSDVASLNFAQSNLTNVEAGIYRARYPAFDYARHVPVVTEGNAYAAGTTWSMMDGAGEARFVNGNGTDIPYVGVTMDQRTGPNYTIALGYEWNVIELNQAMMAGVNMSAEKPLLANRGVERQLYDIAVVGAPEKGAAFTGLINDASVTTVDATPGDNGVTAETKSPDESLRDVVALMSGIPRATGNNEYADALRVAPSLFDYWSVTRLGSGDGSMTILDFIREKNVYTSRTRQPLDIDVIQELETAGEGGTRRMVAYRKAPEVVRFWLPMPARSLPLRSRSIMSYEGAIMARTGGTQIRLTGAVRYSDGL